VMLIEGLRLRGQPVMVADQLIDRVEAPPLVVRGRWLAALLPPRPRPLAPASLRALPAPERRRPESARPRSQERLLHRVEREGSVTAGKDAAALLRHVPATGADRLGVAPARHGRHLSRVSRRPVAPAR